MKITSSEYWDHRNEYAGYCSHCDDITQEYGVEPDAEGYPCPVCGNKTLMGTEEAMLLGLLQIED